MTTILFVPDVLHVIDVSVGPGDLDPLRGIEEKSGQQYVGDKDEPLDPGAPVAAPREEVGAGRQPRIQQDPVVGQGGKKIHKLWSGVDPLKSTERVKT